MTHHETNVRNIIETKVFKRRCFVENFIYLSGIAYAFASWSLAMIFFSIVVKLMGVQLQDSYLQQGILFIVFLGVFGVDAFKNVSKLYKEFPSDFIQDCSDEMLFRMESTLNTRVLIRFILTIFLVVIAIYATYGVAINGKIILFQ